MSGDEIAKETMAAWEQWEGGKSLGRAAVKEQEEEEMRKEPEKKLAKSWKEKW